MRSKPTNQDTNAARSLAVDLAAPAAASHHFTTPSLHFSIFSLCQ
ncbi:MAG TPA: hypothetical protein VNZ64_19645 [Candidatus Acidoferrum sp.]|nr:hypothetical protein [Candidatus Acidoferrum sp.]